MERKSIMQLTDKKSVYVNDRTSINQNLNDHVKNVQEDLAIHSQIWWLVSGGSNLCHYQNSSLRDIRPGTFLAYFLPYPAMRRAKLKNSLYKKS